MRRLLIFTFGLLVFSLTAFGQGQITWGKEKNKAPKENVSTRNKNKVSREKKDVTPAIEEVKRDSKLIEKLIVSGINATLFDSTGKRTRNISKADSLEISFGIIVPKERDTAFDEIYVTVTDPEHNVLNPGYKFKSEDTGEMTATWSEKFTELSGDKKVVFSININSQLQPGNYQIAIYDKVGDASECELLKISNFIF